MTTYIASFLMSAPSGFTYRGIVGAPVNYPARFEPVGKGLGGTFNSNPGYVAAVLTVGTADTYM